MVWSRSTSWSVAMSRTEPNDLVERGRRVLALEAEAIRRVAERLGPVFAAAVHLLAGAPGRLIISGGGKSGLIARKIAATFTSTGTPASFLHPLDSLHGDLGIVGRRDVAILLSKSGASGEVFGLVSQNNSSERSEEHTSELQSRSDLVCRLLLEKKKNINNHLIYVVRAR